MCMLYYHSVGYEIAYTTDASLPTRLWQVLTAPASSSQFSITRLQPDTQYYVKFRPVGTFGTLPYNSVESIATGSTKDGKWL